MKLDIPLMSYAKVLKTKTEDGKRYIWDDIRKKWYVLQPEEFVRQLLVQYLIQDCGYNKNKIQIEKGLVVNGKEKRFDILVYDEDFRPYLLVECKRPEIPVDQKVFDQISVYNIELQVPYLLVSNGLDTYACSINQEEKSYAFLDAIPLPNKNDKA